MSKFSENVERTIILKLKEKPYTLKQIAEETGMNYYTVRNAIHNLAEAGGISTQGISTRNQVFILKENVDILYALPTITVNSKKVGIQSLLAWAGNEQKSAAYLAVQSLPRHVSRILKLCEAVTNDINIAMDLRRIKKEMEGDLTALRRMVKIYEQILQNDNVWNPDSLRYLTEHPDYDANLIENTYRYYYPNG